MVALLAREMQAAFEEQVGGIMGRSGEIVWRQQKGEKEQRRGRRWGNRVGAAGPGGCRQCL